MNNQSVAAWILGLVVFLFLFGGFGMMGYGNGGMMGMMSGNYGSGMMFFGWLYGVLILIALLLFIAWLVKQLQRPHRK